jgi:hypothetical protein
LPDRSAGAAGEGSLNAVLGDEGVEYVQERGEVFGVELVDERARPVVEYVMLPVAWMLRCHP